MLALIHESEEGVKSVEGGCANLKPDPAKPSDELSGSVGVAFFLIFFSTEQAIVTKPTQKNASAEPLLNPPPPQIFGSNSIRGTKLKSMYCGDSLKRSY